jgi:hypothetical protein
MSGVAIAFASATLTTIAGAMFLVAVRVSGVARPWRIAADVVVVIGIVVTSALVIVDFQTGELPVYVRPGLVWTILAISLPAMVVRRLLHHRHVTSRTVIGAISAYLLIAVAFESVFVSLDIYQDVPFFGHPEPTPTFMYFSLSSLTTLGLGDVAAASNLGRFLSVSEAVIGQMFLVTILALVVGLMGQRFAAGGRAPADLPAPSDDTVADPNTEADRPDVRRAD